jgi:uncharacterized protein YdeI (YjbR/CyaY-like superfamily)
VETIASADAAKWESWLTVHHAKRDGVWLKIAEKGSRKPSVTAAEAGDVALCYGWIDSQRKSHDDAYFLQKYTPRPARELAVAAQLRAHRGADRGRTHARSRPGTRSRRLGRCGEP